MKVLRILHDLGQSLWLDNITRNLLRMGVLRRYIDEFLITGLTSNPTIFDHAIKNSTIKLIKPIKRSVGWHEPDDARVSSPDL
jgi:transaldolase